MPSWHLLGICTDGYAVLQFPRLSCARPQPGYETVHTDMYFSQDVRQGAIAPDVVTEAYEGSVQEDRGAVLLWCWDAVVLYPVNGQGHLWEMTEKVKWTARAGLAKLGDPAIIAGCQAVWKQLKERVLVSKVLRNLGDLKRKSDFRTGKRTGDTCCNTWYLRCQGDTQTQDTIRELLADMGCTSCKYRIFQRSVSPLLDTPDWSPTLIKMADKDRKGLERSDSHI